MYKINISKILFGETNKSPNILFSTAGGLTSIFFISHFTGNILFLISSLILVIITSLFIANNFGNKNKSLLARRIRRALRSIKNKKELQFNKIGLIFIILVLAHLGVILLILIIISIHIFYVYLFIILLFWIFLDIFLEKNKKHNVKKSFEEALEKTDHFESSFFEKFIYQLFTIKGFFYSFLFIFSIGYAAAASAIAILGTLNITKIGEVIPENMYLFSPQITSVLLSIYLIFDIIALLILYLIPLYFNLKILQANTLRCPPFKEKDIFILRKPLWSLTFFFFYTTIPVILFPFSRISVYVITAIIPIIHLFMIVSFLIKKKREEKIEILSKKTEERGAIIFFSNILLLVALNLFFPLTPYANDFIIATLFLMFFIFGLMLFISLLIRIALDELGSHDSRVSWRERWKR